ncbi:MAG: class II aldolase/adducin family protein [Pseudomonadota bacterium]
MTSPADLRAAPAFDALLAASEEVGSDPLQVQGPGGNTSIKTGDLMAIKASGTWLAEARKADIMVTVDLARLRGAMAANDPGVDDTAVFCADDPANGPLRPSIETTVHAVFDHPVVMHTHCVETIALAVREDAEAEVEAQLGDLGAVFTPYVKPGADLARAILARVRPDTRIVVLGNHGLVAGGADAAEAKALLAEVGRRLRRPPAPGAGAAPGFAEALARVGWTPVDHAQTQAVAMDPVRAQIAAGRTLYPDHLIFLGPGVAVAGLDEPLADAARRAGASDPPRKILIAPGQGAAIPEDATPSVIAMARALGDVLARIDPHTPLTRLSAEDEAALLNWDAEKYRQALETARGRG